MKIIFISFLVVASLIGAYGQVPDGAPGGFYDANDPETYAEIRRLTKDGVCEGETCFRLVAINNVAMQVVAGVKYIVNGVFKENASRSYYNLNVSVYHVVWEDKVERKDFFSWKCFLDFINFLFNFTDEILSKELIR